MKGVGIDGCRGGWFAVWTGDGARWKCALYPDMAAVWRDHSDAAALFADIPIGLPGQGTRLADTLARQRLGARGASVFNVPARQAALFMGREDTPLAVRKAAARDANRRLSGKSLSEQSLCIVKKILEMDAFLLATPAARARVFEAHPEVCFSLAGGAPMVYSKKEFLGGLERLRLVEQWIPAAQSMLKDARGRYPRTAVAADDMLDAMILAASAFCCQGCPTPMPDPPERDGAGVAMAIWYHDFNHC